MFEGSGNGSGSSELTPRVYLLDVEGTTSPISLVYEQLYPHARKHLDSFLQQHVDDPEMQNDLALLAQENRMESDEEQVLRFAQEDERLFGSGFAGEEGIKQAVVYLLWLMDQDRKSTALKSIQGKVWKSGFDAGELLGTIFPDVADALARWSRHARVAIYSSGSVDAQQQLFRHSSAGDLTPYIAAYFDTRVGLKADSESYRVIADQLGVPSGEVLFISDVVRELDAAREAGSMTRLSIREGNQPVADLNGHAAIRSFAELD